MDFRTARSIETPIIASRRLVIGWECQRPFIGVRKYDAPEVLDNGVVYVGEEFTVFIGGCAVWQGPGCEVECDGCMAYASSFETDYDDEMGEDAEAILFADANDLAATVGHGARCVHDDVRGTHDNPYAEVA